MIRITGGTAKGRKLKGPKGYEFRPTTGVVKEFIFSIISQEVKGAVFLDLFSGAGSFGIDAISRGAEKVVFVEKSFASLKILRHNLELCSFLGKAEIIRGDVFKIIKLQGSSDIKYEFIFADPPFKGMFREKIVKAVDSTDILKHDGLLIIEHERHDRDPMEHSMILQRQKQFGASVISIYRKEV